MITKREQDDWLHAPDGTVRGARPASLPPMLTLSAGSAYNRGMTATEPTVNERMIARRVSKGHNPAESAALLDELLATLTGTALALALHYHAFATARFAEQYAAAL